MKDRILAIFQDSSKVRRLFMESGLDCLEATARTLAQILKQGGKILLFGNGGSAADAQHLAAEFVNRYMIDRPPLAAVALTTDTSVITAIGNDFSYQDVFAKQLRALGQPGDAAVGISTSGKSENVVSALSVARGLGLVTIGLGGPPDTAMSRECSHYLSVTGGPTPRIQETQLIIGHALVELVDELLFANRI